MQEEQKNKLILEMMIMKFNHLHDIDNALDQKIGISVAILMGLIGSIFIFLKENIGLNFLTLGAIILFISFSILIYILKTKLFKYPPSENYLFSKKVEQMNYENLEIKMSDHIKRAFKDNLTTHENKSEYFNSALSLIWIAFFLIIFYFIYQYE